MKTTDIHDEDLLLTFACKVAKYEDGRAEEPGLPRNIKGKVYKFHAS